MSAEWLLDEEGTAEARELLAGYALLIALRLVLVDLCSVAWKKWKRGEIIDEHAMNIARTLPQLMTLLACRVGQRAFRRDSAPTRGG